MQQLMISVLVYTRANSKHPCYCLHSHFNIVWLNPHNADVEIAVARMTAVIEIQFQMPAVACVEGLLFLVTLTFHTFGPFDICIRAVDTFHSHFSCRAQIYFFVIRIFCCCCYNALFTTFTCLVSCEIFSPLILSGSSQLHGHYNLVYCSAKQSRYLPDPFFDFFFQILQWYRGQVSLSG